MFQDYALLPHLTALDNVGFGLKMRRLPKAEIEEQSMQALRDIGLEHEAQRKPEASPAANSNASPSRAP